MTPWSVVTAQSGGESELFARILIPCVVLIGLIIVAWIVVALVRRRTSASDLETASNMPFTLDALRRMHAEGKLTDDEFDRAKARMLHRATGKAPLPATAADLTAGAADETGDDYDLGPNLLDDAADNGDSPDRT